jgi:hypothetical protein
LRGRQSTERKDQKQRDGAEMIDDIVRAASETAGEDVSLARVVERLIKAEVERRATGTKKPAK